MTSEAAIEIDRVSYRYGRRVALRDLSLEVPRGSVLGLCGRNGAGKTTALRLCQGLLHPRTGTIRMLGFDPVRQGLAVRERAPSTVGRRARQ